MTTGGFAGEGPVVVPTFVPGIGDDRRVDRERAEDGPVEDASPEEIEEEAEVVAHLEDPEVDEAIRHLRGTQD